MTARRPAPAPWFAALLLGWLLPVWAAAAADWQLDIHFSSGVLQMWQLQLEASPRAALQASELQSGYRLLRLAGRSTDHSDQQAWFPGRIELRRGDRSLRIRQPRLRLDTRLNAVLLFDVEGRAWASAEMPHRHTGEGRLDWRHMNLRLLPAAARRLGEPMLAEQVLGSVDLRGPSAFENKGNQFCRDTVIWPSAGVGADISLFNIGSVSAMGCYPTACELASQDREVIIAPDAELLNVGASDVPWAQKFSSPRAPYDNDQHPYLVWALYRIDADGSLQGLGASGVKHAFFAQNDMCACAGDSVLYRGCSDLYSASTNNFGSFLGPREEIAPRSGLWGRCGSVFDPNCDSIQDSSGFASDGFSRRLRVSEAELLPALHPGASYWIEAWYVVRDDVDLDNSMAHRQVVPTKTGSAWTFPVSGAVRPGPLVARWHDSVAAGLGGASRRIEHSNGRLQLVAKVSDAGGGLYRYRYALMNLDFAEAQFSGSEPGLLRLLAQRGATGLGFAVERDQVDAPQFRDDDGDAGSDWVASSDGSLSFDAPAERSLGWGRLATLEFTSARPPDDDPVELRLGGAERIVLPSIAPAPANRVFRGRFEDGCCTPPAASELSARRAQD